MITPAFNCVKKMKLIGHKHRSNFLKGKAGGRFFTPKK